LLMLGAQTISSFDEGTDRATIAANLYDSARDELLRSHPWNCATKRVVLAPDSEAPAFGYDTAFTLPADFLRVVEVGDYNEDIDWKVESGKILASGTALKLRYIWKNTTESTWDAMLVHAMELKMAAAMAYAITASAAKEQVQLEKLERYMKRCRAVDGQDDPAQQLGDERLLTARFGNFNYAPGR
jgi:hypothetical protein